MHHAMDVTETGCLAHWILLTQPQLALYITSAALPYPMRRRLSSPSANRAPPGCRPGWWALYGPILCPQLVEQCLGLLEVGGVEPLGEPGVHRRQQHARRLTLALALPPLRQARGRPEFPGFGVLL